MNRVTRWMSLLVCWGASQGVLAAPPDYAQEVLPILQSYCLDCHYDGEDAEGGVNLERFGSVEQVMADRVIWKAVFEKVESRQMPPPKEAALPSDQQRRTILDFITDIAARPHPALGAIDPGKPMLRRLTRLEYNNTVRDLLELDVDVFMFPERLPLIDKDYFQPGGGKLAGPLQVRMREYGAKYPVLLPASGLPGDNRAEHGYRNRGDAMNTSPLLLEKYVALAGEIVQHPDLPRRSPVFAELLGIDPKSLLAPTETALPGARAGAPVDAVARFAPRLENPRQADGNPDRPDEFRRQLTEAFEQGRGGVFDVPDSLRNQTVAGKGGLIKVALAGDKLLAINPNADLWLVDFATAEETSGSHLVANKTKGEKVYELTFDVRGGDEGEGITRLGVCVLGRRNQQGDVTLTATLTDDTTEVRTATIPEGPAGTTYFSFAATPGESIRRLKVDGSRFSGDYVLIDDLGFLTNGRARRRSPAARNGSPDPPGSPPPIASPTDMARDFQPQPPRERLAAFLGRAFRRPVDEQEVQRYLALFESAGKSGKTEADAMRVAAQAVLSSPSFLFLAESSPGDKDTAAAVRELTDYELANRLSYFLWSSMPDAELLRLAAEGRLRDEATLREQTRRMLRDPRARELSESFAVQWLRLDQLYTAKPDRELFSNFYSGPQGKSTLHAAQLVEALLLFDTVLIENRGILDFIAADYTWLNPRLAQLYGINLDAATTGDPSDVAGAGNRELRLAGKNADNTWHRVPLSDPVRGGYLTMSGPLTVTSLPFRTSPVKRGAWLLETIFNRPPTEPKVAFAIENDTKEAATAQSIREKFEMHRNKPACYSCHIRLDPPGFALERFDAVGALRDRDAGAPVDARGEWNGAEFNGPAEFKALLLRDPHEFTRGFIEHLLSYALGRKLEIHDMPAVTAIEEAARREEFRLQDIVFEIVASRPFRYTRR